MSLSNTSLKYAAQAFLCILLLFFSSYIFSQTKLKWGDIPKAHLVMDKCPFEEDAKAMVIIDQGVVNFQSGKGYKTYMHKHKRIKIFDKSASDEGDIKLRYYHKYKIDNLKAQVIDKNGNITVLDKKQIFDERINEYYKSKNFAIPNVQEGSVLEIKYTLLSPYVSELFEWYFQEDIPVAKSELEVTIPPYYDYAFIFQGNNSPTRTDKKGIYLFSMDEVPSLKEEAYITSMDNYRNRIRFQLQQYFPPGSEKQTFMSDWEELNDELCKSQYCGKKLKSKKQFGKINAIYQSWVNGVVGMSKVEQVESIFRFVQEKMTDDGFIGISSQDKLDEIFSSGKGSVQEINMIVAGLLRFNGIESNLVLLPTRSHGLPLELYPIRDQFNYIVAVAQLDDKLLFLDASEEMNPPGQLATMALNTKGYMISESGGKWLDLPIQKDKEITYFKGTISEEGELSGTWTKQLDAYSSVSAKKSYSLNGESSVTKGLEDKFTEVAFSNISLEELKGDSEKVKYSVDVSVPEACTTVNDFIYFNPILHTSFSENPFKLKERTYPVDMPYPFMEKFILNLELSENMEIEELPESQSFALPDGAGKFTYDAKKVGDKLAINSTLDFSRRTFSPEEYEGLKTFFEHVVDKQNSQIVFKVK